MKKNLLTLAALFTTMLVNANGQLTPIMQPDTSEKNIVNIALSVVFVAIGLFLIALDKKMNKTN